MRKEKYEEKKWKPIIVGIVVFIVVFIGLTLYQQSSNINENDMILTENEATQESEENVINVVIEETVTTIFIDIGGAVNVSGLFALPAGSRVADAIEAAGGLTENAEIKYINRAFVLSDGDRLYIPTISEVQDGTAPPTAGQVSSSGGAAASPGTETGSVLININTAGSDELQKLSGVGPVTAQKIIDYRSKRGDFKRIEDLMNVSGIGVKTFEKLRDYITI